MAERLLHHKRVTAEGGEPERWLYMLHGIFGAGRNWATISRRLVRANPGWGAVLVDLREHGASQGFPPPHTLDAAAADLVALTERTGAAAEAVLGHSFGGKVALAYARDAAGDLGQLWVIDSTPEARSPGGSAWAMLDRLRRLPERFSSRRELVEALERDGIATPIARWMATNLQRADADFRWRFDLDALEALLRDFFRTDLWPVIERPPGRVQLHLVKATESDIITAAAVARVEAAARETGRVFLHHVPGGHWLNTDNPDALVELLTTALQRA